MNRALVPHKTSPPSGGHTFMDIGRTKHASTIEYDGQSQRTGGIHADDRYSNI